VDRTTVTADFDDEEAGEDTTSASAQVRSACSTHTAVPGRNIIAAAPRRRRRRCRDVGWGSQRWRCGLWGGPRRWEWNCPFGRRGGREAREMAGVALGRPRLW